MATRVSSSTFVGCSLELAELEPALADAAEDRPWLASRDQEADGPADTQAEDPFGLTPRERRVLELIAQGATNREIGAELFMAEKTASVHVSRILMKLDVRSRTEAAGVAHRLGWDR